MEGRWRESGGKVEGKWREGGGKVVRRWREGGGKVEGRWRKGGGWRESGEKMEGRWREGGGKVRGGGRGKSGGTLTRCFLTETESPSHADWSKACAVDMVLPSCVTLPVEGGGAEVYMPLPLHSTNLGSTFSVHHWPPPELFPLDHFAR